MSSSLGLSYGEEQISAARANAKSLFWGTGSDIANISPSDDIVIAFCVEDGSGFSLNHLYLRHWDDGLEAWTGWDDVSRKHTHSADTESEGGDFVDIINANIAQSYTMFRPTMSEEYFYYTDDSNDGTPILVFDDGATNTQYLELRTGTATDGWAYVQDGGVQLSLNDNISWHVKMEVDTADTQTSVLWRLGVGMETPNETAEDTLQKFGIEGCTGTNEYIQVVSCDGDTRIQDSTGVEMDTGAAIGVKLDYVPSTSVTYEDTLGTIVAATSNFPSSGNIESDKTLRYGIKSTNTTAKELRIWADALIGKILDPAWI